MSAIITQAVNMYTGMFAGYIDHFLQWGEEFFYVGLVITIVWMCLWNAFDKQSFTEATSEFIKEFFIIALFYTLMLNGIHWLQSIPQTAQSIGKTLAGGSLVDPSSIIDRGINAINYISTALHDAGWVDKLMYSLIFGIIELVILFVFISIALDLAVTILLIQFFIVVSGFFLAFAVFPFTRSVARKTLDLVMANSMKLMALYIIVAAGSKLLNLLSEEFTGPGAKFTIDAVYTYTATVLLFWLISKNIPSQVARIFSEVVQESRGTSAAGLAMAAINTAKTHYPAMQMAAGGATGLTKIAGSTIGNMGAHFNHAQASGAGLAASVGKALGGAGRNTLGSIGGSVSDHFKHITEKLSGGKGMVDEQGNKNIPKFAQRMHAAAQMVKSTPPSGAPSSAGRKAAGSNATRRATKY